MDNSSSKLIDQLGLVGDDIALVDIDGATCTRAALGETISRTMEWLTTRDKDHGGRVLTLLVDHPSTLPFQLAASASMPTLVVNPASSSREIAGLLKETKATAIVTNSSRDDVEALIDQFDIGHIELLPRENSHFADFDLALRRAGPKSSADIVVPSLVLTTSGSSGKPKVVSISHRALLSSAGNIAQALELGKEDINVHMLPMFHIGAILDLFVVSLMSGGRVCLAHPISTENLIRAIHDIRPTWVQAVPTMLKALVRTCSDHELEDLGRSLRFVRSVSAGLAPGIQAEIETKMNVPVIQMYGMTETAGQICSNGLSTNARKPGSVGRPMGCEVRILDQNGNVVPLGQDGEVCVAGDIVFAGYDNMSRAETFHGRWFRTGDVGYFDDDNFLYLVAREGDLINKGGEKLSAAEVEQALLEHPSVMQAAVFSIPHETLGEDIGAVISFADGALVKEEVVRAFLGQRLSAYKVPRHLLVADTLPQLASSKIDKKTCRERFLNKEPLAHANKSRSAIGTEIALVWTDVLNQPKPMDNDDFFDAGGDSLAAHTFVLNLEERLQVTLPTNILFESPTFGELENAVAKLVESSPRNHEEDQVLRAVRAVTAAWPGTRADEKSLIVGLGDVGEKKPFFFCVNGSQDYLRLVKEMDPERPFYAMRNLNLLPEKSPQNSQKLAKAYADEIDVLQPEGSLIFGGHCGGVDIARMIADILINRGRDVDLIVVIDSVLHEPCPAQALVIWTNNTDYSHYSGTAQFVEPERGAAYVFPLGAQFNLIAENHAGLMEGKAVKTIAKMIEAEISRDRTIPDDVGAKLDKARSAFEQRKTLYDASLKIDAPRFFNAKGHVDVLVTLKNNTSQSWAPTRESGILVMAKWKRANGKMYLDPAGYAELTDTVEPGAEAKVRIRVKCRHHRTPLRLVIDLVDDGVAWFSWHGKPAAEHWMMPRYF